MGEYDMRRIKVFGVFMFKEGVIFRIEENCGYSF